MWEEFPKEKERLGKEIFFNQLVYHINETLMECMFLEKLSANAKQLQFRDAPTSGQDCSRFPLSSSSIKHTWQRGLGLQQAQQVCNLEMTPPVCPYTWMR